MFYRALLLASFIASTSTVHGHQLDPVEVKDPAALGKRLTPLQQPVPIRAETPPPNVITLVGEVKAPVLNGVTLQSSDVYVGKDNAFVTYNLAGNAEAGAIDVVGTRDPRHPKIVKHVYYEHADINGVTELGDALHLVGNTSFGGWPQAFLQILPLRNPTTPRQLYPLPGFAGTDITHDGKHVFATSGDDGGVTVVDPTLKAGIAATPIRDARGVAVNETRLFVTGGSPGKSTSSARRRNGNRRWKPADQTHPVEIDDNARPQHADRVRR